MYASRSESIIVLMFLQPICVFAQLPWHRRTGHIVGLTNSLRQRANSPSAGRAQTSEILSSSSLSAHTGLPQAAVPQQASAPMSAGFEGGAVSVFFGRSILNESSAHAAFPISVQRAMRNTTMTEVARIKRFCN